MMPITLQKRLRQAGQIRIGAKVATRNGGSRPTKLDAFRVTSADKSVIEAVAAAFGGDVQPWTGAPSGTTQWEVFTKATEMEVVLPPTDIALSQWFELWQGSGLQRRCTGDFMITKDGKPSDEEPCICNPDERECRPTTRLNVILAAVDGIGVFRFESHAYSSAAEIGGSIEILKQLQARGQMVPGRLILEQRQSKGLNATSGKNEVYHYAVAVLDLKINVASLTSGGSRPAIGVTPIHSPSDLPPVQSVSEQLAASQKPVERPKRANAQAPLPATGLKPRGLSTAIKEPEESKEPTEPPKDHTPGGASTKSLRRLMAILNGREDIGKERDDRLAWAKGILGIDVASFNDLNQAQVTKLNDVATEVPFPTEATEQTLGGVVDPSPF